jgi:hypothetical protein
VQFAAAAVGSGRIAWVAGQPLGVQFDEPIRATELLVQMSHSRQPRPAAGSRHAARPPV